MEKNWLIRTKNNHILGPVSKSKIKELIANGSLKGDDEICSGNGHWLFVREKELLDKYVHGDFLQDFNPVSEAATVVANKTNESILDNENHFPKDEDLAYPDEDDLAFPETTSDELREDVTIVAGISMQESIATGLRDIEFESNESDTDLGKDTVNGSVDDDSDFDFDFYVDDQDQEANTLKENSSNQKKRDEEVIQSPPLINKKNKVKSQSVKSKMSINILYVLGIVFVILAILSLYFRNRILNSFDQETVSFQFINSAHAQIKDMQLEKKKPSFIQQ